MSDLAAFLLARIDEDEAEVRALADHGGRTGEPGRCREHGAADGFDWIATDEWDDGYRLATTADRVLAECEAKRQLITTADRLIRSFDQPGLFWDDVNRRERSHARTTLHLLALPYASHPDYDETWRI